jgi:gamma-glutamyltranspeptidase/glutathione hydrolase
VLQPAIDLADRGFALPPGEATRMANVASRLREFRGSRAHFLKANGVPYIAGETFRQPDLARTLRAIAAGGEDAFYRGEVARRIVVDMRANGGLVTASDLAAYRAEESIIVRGSYRGHDLVGSYLPASGATTIEILQILDQLDLSRIAGTSDWVAVVAQALLLGFADRTADMANAQAKATWLTSRELAAQRAREIRLPGGRDRQQTQAAAWPFPSHARPFAKPLFASGVRAMEREPAHTTHLSVADRAGSVVALTQSVGPTMGSKVATEGLGFVYAATMGYLGELEPGTRRHWSSQSPLLVLRDGQPVLVLGAAGARRIISAVVATVSRTIDQQLPLVQALAAPRFHPLASRIDLEQRPGTAWSASDVTRLDALEFRVETRNDAPYFARINAIAWDGERRVWIGVADPRWPGAAGAPAR